jgi:hypothetical protein
VLSCHCCRCWQKWWQLQAHVPGCRVGCCSRHLELCWWGWGVLLLLLHPDSFADQGYGGLVP